MNLICGNVVSVRKIAEKWKSYNIKSEHQWKVMSTCLVAFSPPHHYRNHFVLNTNHHNNVRFRHRVLVIIVWCNGIFLWLSVQSGRKKMSIIQFDRPAFISSPEHLKFKLKRTWSENVSCRNILVMFFLSFLCFMRTFCSTCVRRRKNTIYS